MQKRLNIDFELGNLKSIPKQHQWWALEEGQTLGQEGGIPAWGPILTKRAKRENSHFKTWLRASRAQWQSSVSSLCGSHTEFYCGVLPLFPQSDPPLRQKGGQTSCCLLHLPCRPENLNTKPYCMPTLIEKKKKYTYNNIRREIISSKKSCFQFCSKTDLCSLCIFCCVDRVCFLFSYQKKKNLFKINTC